jgi:hypothetical protein
MKPRILVALGFVVAIFVCPNVADADPNADNLWLGNDTNASLGLLNTTTTGTVLRTIPNTAGVGFAVDTTLNRLYVNSTFTGGGVYDLSTLALVGSFTLPHSSEDMTFSNGFIWSGDFSGLALDEVNPTTGTRVGGFSVGFEPLGLTTDGAGGFWVSEFASGALLRHFDGSGNLLGTMNPADITGFRGGLGFDPVDGTLFIGTSGEVFHYTTTGTDLGHFSTGDGRFVDGLEFVSGTAVPEPATGLLVGLGMFVMFLITRRAEEIV